MICRIFYEVPKTAVWTLWPVEGWWVRCDISPSILHLKSAPTIVLEFRLSVPGLWTSGVSDPYTNNLKPAVLTLMVALITNCSLFKLDKIEFSWFELYGPWCDISPAVLFKATEHFLPNRTLWEGASLNRNATSHIWTFMNLREVVVYDLFHIYCI